MYSPTTKLIAKTSTVRLRTCSRVGQLTFRSSDQTHRNSVEVASRRGSTSFRVLWQGR